MEIIGQKFEAGEYFLTELIMAGELMNEALGVLEPHIKGATSTVKGKMVLGTVKGDLHDIGKGIAKMFLTVAGFDVIDLGVDVPGRQFVEAIKSHGASVLGMSALLSNTMSEMGTVVEGLKREGIRDDVKVVIGGAAVSLDFCKKIGADYATRDAVDGANMCKKWILTR